MNPTLVVVGADKGGVGKTTMSRLLLDYMASRGTPARAFDTEHPRGTLKRFHPDITDVVVHSPPAGRVDGLVDLAGAGLPGGG